MFLYWHDATEEALHFSFQLVRMLSESVNGGGDFNEIHRVARHIRPGNREDWHRQFVTLGDRIKVIAEAALEQNHETTAGEALLRAFCYYRAAEWILPGADERKIPLYEQAMLCFHRALKLSDYPHEHITVPYDGHQLAGYFFPPRARVRAHRSPCVIFLSGADALPEENFFRGVQTITARGSACLIFNGPGQGRSLRLMGLTTIPDYERPVRAAVDYLMTRCDIDPERVGLLGVSMAGYYGLRAVCFEHRLKACVVWGALYNVLTDLYLTFPPIRRQLQWIVGARDDAGARERYAAFTLEGLLHQVHCPVLITHGVNDRMVPVQSAHRTYEELQVEKELRLYDAEQGGAEHCSIDNWTQVVPYQVDWLLDRI